MRHLKYIALILLISACTNKKETQKKTEIIEAANQTGIFSVIEIKRDYFDKVAEESSTIIDTSHIKKYNGQITLPMNSDEDSLMIFKDKKNTIDGEHDVTYNYLGYYKSIDKYLLETVYYESVTYDLISKNGYKTRIWDKPRFSKKGDFFVCLSPYRLEGEPVGLQIWKIKTDEYDTEDTHNLENIFELNQLVFNPVDCRWDEQESLLIQAEKFNGNFYPKSPPDIYYLKLQFK